MAFVQRDMSRPPTVLGISPGTIGADGAAERSAQVFLAALGAAEGAGLAGVILREPNLGDRATLALARAARAILPRGDRWLCIHDRLHLIGAANADAGHLGGQSLPFEAARRAAGPDVPLGVSVHRGDRAQEGAAYGLLAPVFEPNSKDRGHGDSPPLGVEEAHAIAEVFDLPLWALGGVDAQNAAQIQAPFAGVAAIGGLWGDVRAPGLSGVRTEEVVTRVRDLATSAGALER